MGKQSKLITDLLKRYSYEKYGCITHEMDQVLEFVELSIDSAAIIRDKLDYDSTSDVLSFEVSALDNPEEFETLKDLYYYGKTK